MREVDFETSVLALHYFSDNKLNANFFQITRFKENKDMAVKRYCHKKLCLQVITWNRIYLSKQVVQIANTRKEMLFCNCYFWRFVSHFLLDRVKTGSVLWSVRSSLVSHRREDQINTVCKKKMYFSVCR